MRRNVAVVLLSLTLCAGACGDKDADTGAVDGSSATDGSDGSGDGADGTGDGADGGDGTADGSDGADGGSDGTDGGTETWSDTTDVNGVCLDGGCDLQGVGEAARELCFDATNRAEDTSFFWREDRELDDQGVVQFECTSAAVTSAACTDLCAAGEFANGAFDELDTCSCYSVLPRGDLADRMVARGCDSLGGDASAIALGSSADGLAVLAGVQCNGGTTEGSCDDLSVLVDESLGGWVQNVDNFGSGCNLAE